MPMSIWFNKVTVDEINDRAKGTLSDHLGIKFIEIGDDRLVASMPIDPKTTQPMRIMHGGASSALAETVASAAGNYCVDQKQFVCVGLDININHLKPVSAGEVKAIAKPYHLGKSTQVWEIKIYNREKTLISIGRLTLAVLKRK